MMWAAVAVVVIVVVLVGAAYATHLIGPKAATGNGYQPPCASLKAAGSTFVFPLFAVWATDYAGFACSANTGFTQVQVNYQPVGSGAGITELQGRLVQIGASDAPLTPVQTAALPGKAITMPDSAGAVTVMYNLKGINQLNLTGAILEDIYNGTITSWNVTAIQQINPGINIPNVKITPVVRLDGSGTTYAFTTFLGEESAWWLAHVGVGTKVSWPYSGVVAFTGSEGIAGGVATTVGAIGYAELNYAEGEGANVEIAKIMNPAGFYIEPTVADTASAVAAITTFPSPEGNWSGFNIENQAGNGTYPIATFTYLMFYVDMGPLYTAVTQQQAQAMVSFLWWITHTGQASAPGLFYVPLPASVVASVCEPAINDVVFNGASLTSH